MLQYGTSRASASADDVTDLQHDAQFHHFTIGYQFDRPSKPRLDAIVDYASGDEDPDDGENNRFDTLFGARRDYQPVGIFGPIARSNTFSPGLRFSCVPRQGTDFMLGYRFNLLASDRDAMPISGLVDPTGATDRTVGHLIELRVRHDIVPKSLRLEFGAAQLFAGDFITDAPNSTTQGDTTYFYIDGTFFL